MIVRPAAATDFRSIVEIYDYYVLNSSATFETESPAEDEMLRRWEEIVRNGLPYLVAEVDGTVAGFAYAALYRPRRAYRFTVEDSIYIRPGFEGRKLGTTLLTSVIQTCEEQGYRQMIAVIGGGRENAASVALHERLGFTEAGLLSKVGYKFGRWVDTVLMQRELGAGATACPCEI